MKLADLATGRDNNFNLIRMLAAYAVLVSHSYALATGDPTREPLYDLLGMTAGSIAVEVFFVTSGFLVTASLIARRDLLAFTVARVLRIYPGLLVMLGLTALLLGPVFTTLPLAEYFTDRQLYVYLRKCGTLFLNVSYELPEVFEANPWESAVNGSLWTLPHEVRMYAALAVAWVVGHWLTRTVPGAFAAMIVAATCVAGLYHLMNEAYGFVNHRLLNATVKLFYFFFLGVSFYLLRERIALNTYAFLAGCCVLVVALLLDKALFHIAYYLLIAYLLLFLAYVPGGAVRRYNALGDYSYGIYIYAFPIQQATAALLPGVTPLDMFVVSSLITLLFAIASWHLVESRALVYKRKLSAA